jgi:predicted NBD/HSP70 family sugar kinase
MEPSDARQANRSQVLWELLQRGVTRRDELAMATSLSAATVSRVIDGLVQDGLVREGAAVRTGQRGRRISSVEFVSEVGSVIGVDVGGSNSRLIKVDLLGSLLGWKRVATPSRLSVRGLARWLVDHITSFASGVPLSSVVVGLPGIVDPGTHSVRGAPNLPQLEGTDFVSSVHDQLDVPISFDNDSNLAVLGELHLGAAVNHRSAVMLTIGTGLGAGVVVDGHLLRGKSGFVGEFGYIPVGTRGETLEDVLSGGGLLKEAARLGLTLESPKSIFSQRTPKGLIRLRRRFEHGLLLVLLAITTAYEPEIIVIGGGIASSLQNILPEIEGRLKIMMPESPALATSSLGDPAGAVGALICGLQDAYVRLGVDATTLNGPVGLRLADLLTEPQLGF